MIKSTAIAGIALSISLMSCAGAGAPRSTQQGPAGARMERIVTIRTEEGVVFRRYGQLSVEEQRRIDQGLAVAHRELLKARAADPAGDLGAAPTVQELSCGIHAHHGGGGTISIGCSHGLYFCVVSYSADEGFSGQCGKETPVPATPVPG